MNEELELFSTPDGYTYYYLDGSFLLTNDNALDPERKFPCTKEQIMKDLPYYWDEMWNWQKRNCKKAGLEVE